MFLSTTPATTNIFTLSLHDALPIYEVLCLWQRELSAPGRLPEMHERPIRMGRPREGSEACDLHLRSEEHTSELQSPDHLVCRLLLEKKKEMTTYNLRGIDERCMDTS